MEDLRHPKIHYLKVIVDEKLRYFLEHFQIFQKIGDRTENVSGINVIILLSDAFRDTIECFYAFGHFFIDLWTKI